jgi:hypothetical protein
MWTESVLRKCNILHILAETADIRGRILRFDIRPSPDTGQGVERVSDGRASCCSAIPIPPGGKRGGA